MPGPGGMPSQGRLISPSILPTAAVQTLPSWMSVRNRKGILPEPGMARCNGSMTSFRYSGQDARSPIGAGPWYFSSARKFRRSGTNRFASVEPISLAASIPIGVKPG